MVSASVVITNYNYGRYLACSIESALEQRHPCEVIVVDDGSTDESHEVVARYRSRIVNVSIEHGGQGAAFNAGFAASTGDVVCFLDADDALLPSALEQAVPHFADARVTKVHWQLECVDATGRRLGELIPELPLPDGDLRDEVLRNGPGGYVWSPTSGNAWSRRFLERVLPMPTAQYVTCAETYLSLWAPVLGRIGAVRAVNALYREHGRNNRYSITAEQIGTFVEHAREVLDDYLRAEGIEVDIRRWLQAFRWPDRDQAVQEIADIVGPHGRFVLIDDGRWGDSFETRDRASRFSPYGDDDVSPAARVAGWRAAGFSSVVIAWPAFEWLHSGAMLASHLKSALRQVAANPRFVLLELTGQVQESVIEHFIPT